MKQFSSANVPTYNETWVITKESELSQCVLLARCLISLVGEGGINNHFQSHHCLYHQLLGASGVITIVSVLAREIFFKSYLVNISFVLSCVM